MTKIFPESRQYAAYPPRWPIGLSGALGKEPLSIVGGQNVSNIVDTLRACPVFVPYRLWVTGIAINVVSAHATPLISFGLYAGSTGFPGALLLDGGETSIATTGLKISTVTPQWLEPGWYFAGYHCSSANGSITGQSTTILSALGKSTYAGASCITGFTKATAYATPLPNPFPVDAVSTLLAQPTALLIYNQPQGD
jgi:hypothetical protein